MCVRFFRTATAVTAGVNLQTKVSEFVQLCNKTYIRPLFYLKSCSLLPASQLYSIVRSAANNSTTLLVKSNA